MVRELRLIQPGAILGFQHVQLDSKAVEHGRRCDGEHSSRCVECDFSGRGQNVARNSRARRIAPLQEPDREYKLVTLLGLFEPAAQEVEAFVSALHFLPPAHLLRPGLPLLDKVLDPGVLDLGVIRQPVQLRNLLNDRPLSAFGRVRVRHLPLGDQRDFRKQIRFLLRLVQIIGAHPIRHNRRRRRPGGYPLLPNFQPGVAQVVCFAVQEGRAALRAFFRDVREPEKLIGRTVGADALLPDACRRLQEGEQSTPFISAHVLTPPTS